MVYEIEIRVQFRSGHRLMAPYEGKCNNPHGEGYTAIVFLEQDVLNDVGMVMDFGECKKSIKGWVDNNWDHAYIGRNDDEVLKFLTENGFRTFTMYSNPTAENMAEHLFAIIKDELNLPVKKVGIIESFEDSIAWYQDE